jgi:hypothetical protein
VAEPANEHHGRRDEGERDRRKKGRDSPWVDCDDDAGSTDDRDMATIGEHWRRVRSRCSTVGWFWVRRVRNVRTRSVGGGGEASI